MRIDNKLVERITGMPAHEFERFMMTEIKDFTTGEKLLKLLLPVLHEKRLKRYHQRVSRLRHIHERMLVENRRWYD
jgi:hypothetical protein